MAPKRRRLSSATAITPCVASRVVRDRMLKILHEEPSFPDSFGKFMVARGRRIQADLTDQLFNSSEERRLARILLPMADYGKPGQPQTFIAPVTQQILAEMIGTTRSHVNVFHEQVPRDGPHRIRRSGSHKQVASHCYTALAFVRRQLTQTRN